MSYEVSKGTTIKTYTSSYKLEEIDNLREYILKQGKKEILIKADSTEEWIGRSFIKDVLVGTAKQEKVNQRSRCQSSRWRWADCV